jgi:hypothetical protein
VAGVGVVFVFEGGVGVDCCFCGGVLVHGGGGWGEKGGRGRTLLLGLVLLLVGGEEHVVW